MEPRIEEFMPRGAGATVDWAAVDAAYAWIRRMRGSTQDPVHHAEGDVWTHVRMVVEELVSSDAWRSEDEADRLVLFAAALLHDVAKPATRREEDGRITNRGHSAAGAIDARGILWRMGFPFDARERVCAIVRAHQTPFWLLDREPWEATRILCETSLSVEPRLVAIHAEADARGRACSDRQTLIDGCDLYRQAAEELGCLDGPFPFASDADRFRYFRAPERRRPDDAVYDTTDPGFAVTVTSGLPGSGKSTWVGAATGRGGSLEGQPIVCLDAIRRRMGVDPAKEQGSVIQAAKEEARVLLRQRRPFVWDATNLSRELRGVATPLFADYGARVRIAYVEASAEDAASRNRSREDVVPEAAMARMMRRWEVPTLAECNELEMAVQERSAVARPGWRR